MTEYLSAAEAAVRLGVSRQTLYAYVSRGLLTGHAAGDPRQRRYDAAEVAGLAMAHRRGRRPKEVAKATLDWGLPVLESAITLIHDGRLYYRGIDAVAHAVSASIEETAGLLWRVPPDAAFPATPPGNPPVMAALFSHYGGRRRDEALLPLFAAATSDDATAVWRENSASGYGDLVRSLVSCVTGAPPSAGPVHQQLAQIWGLDAAGADLVRMALVLCADHELNASSFTARCIASTGASLRACVLGGLAALSGGLHGGMTARIEAFWDGLSADDLTGQIRRRLAAGEALPGFGHKLYPGGDVRAAALLTRIGPDFPFPGQISMAVEGLTGRAPNIDFALVALRRHARLPEGAAFCLFALGRSLGWIAHALEQRETRQLIRPRAIYTGPAGTGAVAVAGINPPRR